METMSSAIHPRGYAYSAIQNILRSTTCNGCDGSLGVDGVGGLAGVAALKHPRALALLVHLVPVPQPDERAPRDVAGVPEVEGEEHDDDRDGEHIVVRDWGQPSELEASTKNNSHNPHSTYTAIAAERNAYSAKSAAGCELALRMPACGQHWGGGAHNTGLGLGCGAGDEDDGFGAARLRVGRVADVAAGEGGRGGRRVVVRLDRAAEEGC